MAYSDFTFAKLKKDYGILQTDVFLFEAVPIVRVPPSIRLVSEIK